MLLMTLNAQPQDWGGLTICGRPPLQRWNAAEVVTSWWLKDDDNSGSISYLVIKGSGAKINTESEYNGLTLYAVGSATQISNVAIINGADDGIGSSAAQYRPNLYLENNEDDAIDWTEGWRWHSNQRLCEAPLIASPQ